MRPTSTFPSAECYYLLTSVEVYCIVTGAQECKQLAQGCYASPTPNPLCHQRVAVKLLPWFQVATKPWKASVTSTAPTAQPVKVRSSSLTRSAAPQSNGNVATPDSPRSDIVVRSRKPSGGIQSTNEVVCFFHACSWSVTSVRE